MPGEVKSSRNVRSALMYIRRADIRGQLSSGSLGTGPGRVRAVCTCSKCAQQRSPMGSLCSSGRSGRSCSTSGPECSRETCGQHHRMSSRSVGVHRNLRHHHRSHRHRHRSQGSGNHRHQPLGSCGQCVRPWSTCSTPGQLHLRNRGRHPYPQQRGWRSHG